MFDNSNILKVFFPIRIIIFLWIPKRTAPDFDSNADSAVSKVQMRILIKIDFFHISQNRSENEAPGLPGTKYSQIFHADACVGWRGPRVVTRRTLLEE